MSFNHLILGLEIAMMVEGGREHTCPGYQCGALEAHQSIHTLTGVPSLYPDTCCSYFTDKPEATEGSQQA